MDLEHTYFDANSFMGELEDKNDIACDAASISSSYHGANSRLFNDSDPFVGTPSREEVLADQMLTLRSFTGDLSSTLIFPDETYCGDPNSRIFTGPLRTPEPYEGIPLDLLDGLGREDRRSEQVFETIPKMRGKRVSSGTRAESLRATVVREYSFDWGDDRAGLPSQRQIGEGSGKGNEMVGTKGMRRSSIWF